MLAVRYACGPGGDYAELLSARVDGRGHPDGVYCVRVEQGGEPEGQGRAPPLVARRVGRARRRTFVRQSALRPRFSSILNRRATVLAFYAVLLAACGAVLLFLPEEVGAAFDGSTGGEGLVQVLGAALLGFAAMTWLVRRAPVGGIYGRPVVGGLQAFTVVGVLSLLGNLPPAPGPAYWGLAAVLALGAGLSLWLMRTSPEAATPRS